ncbi:MAG: peptide chain release factor N(5)-glutamine methyltransferase [Coxiellaceae bacterium]|nr:peptide chain release factor N(5)-glutamine methyltransferase [Coxiellaceae bacterium]
MQLKLLLSQYTEILSSVSESSRLDAECLIAAWLQKPRSFLFAYPEHDVLPDPQLLQWLRRRQKGEPVAYIVGHKEFWSLPFTVSPDVLIPRPETECLVEWLITEYQHPIKCADLGTGSGAIACALAHERPDWHIDATDLSQAALEIAEHNAEALGMSQVNFYKGDWCDALPSNDYDVIVSNPPYIADSDSALEPAVRHYEPLSALIANDSGLSDIKNIAKQAKAYLKPQGVIVLEHGYQQAEAVAEVLRQAGFEQVINHQDFSDLPRFTVGHLPS